MGHIHFMTGRLNNVRSVMALRLLAYNIKGMAARSASGA